MKFQESAPRNFLVDRKTEISVQSVLLLKTFIMLLFIVKGGFIRKKSE